MTKPILLAGLLGGLLGGLLSVAGNRFIAPAKSDPAQHPSPEARAVTELYLAKLKAGKTEEFMKDVKVGMVTLTEADFNDMTKRLKDTLTLYTGIFGPPTGEFELIRESAPSPSLVKLIYLQKYDRGAVGWTFYLCRGKETWHLVEFYYSEKVSSLFSGVQ